MTATTRDAASHRTDWSEPLAAWPGLDVPAWGRWRRAIVATCSEVLAGRRAKPLASANHRDAWAAGIAAFTAGLGPLLGYWIEQGSLAADERLAALLAVHLDHSRRRHRRLAAEAKQLVARLNDAGVTAVLLKGLHVAEYYPDPGSRPFSDVDLFVSVRDLPVAEAVMRGRGLRAGRMVDQRRSWHPTAGERLQSLEFTHADNPWSVDLHWSLHRTRYRALRLRLPAIAPDDCPAWPALGAGARVLSLAPLMSLLAVHAVENLRTFQPLRLVDLALVIRAEQNRGALDWRAIDELLAVNALRHHAYPAFRLVERLAPGVVDAGFLTGLERASSARMVRAMATQELSGDRDPRAWSASEPFLWARGPADWARLLWRQAWPGLDYGTAGDIAGFYLRRIRRLWSGGVRLRPVPTD